MKKYLLSRVFLIVTCLMCAAFSVFADTEVDTLIAELEKHGIEVTEKRDEEGNKEFSVSVWPIKTNESAAAAALRDFAKRNKVTRFFATVDSALTTAFFNALGPLSDVKRLDLYRLAEGSNFSQVPTAFPNAETINLIDVGILDRNTPLFPKARSLNATSSVFDDDGLLVIARMPDLDGDFCVAPNVTDRGLERMAAAMEPEAKARKFLDFSGIKDVARRQNLEKKAKFLGLRY